MVASIHDPLFMTPWLPNEYYVSFDVPLPLRPETRARARLGTVTPCETSQRCPSHRPDV